MPSDKFKQYAWFSVQVDQYYSAVRIFARSHTQFCNIYSSLPTGDDWPSDLSSIPISESAKDFFMLATNTFKRIGTTSIFESSSSDKLNNLAADMLNFSFYTCFCFQWTLFETFVKDSILGLVDEKVFSAEISEELLKIKRSTARFLNYVHKGSVFDRSPFIAELPVTGWSVKTETCTFNDLDRIRNLRNDFIHAVTGPAILPTSEPEKEKLYDRSMWIMRKYAENVDKEASIKRKQQPERH